MCFHDNSKTNTITVDDGSHDLAGLVNAIAEQTELQAESSIHLSDTERIDKPKELIEALFGFDQKEAVEIQSFIEHHKHQYFKTSPGQDEVPQAVQDAEWNRLYYNVWFRRLLLEKPLSTKVLSHKMGKDRFISLMPPSTIADRTIGSETNSLVNCMREKHIAAFDEALRNAGTVTQRSWNTQIKKPLTCSRCLSLTKIP